MSPYITPHHKKRNRAVRIEALRSLILLTVFISVIFLASFFYPVITLPKAPDFDVLPEIEKPDIMSDPVQIGLSPTHRFAMKNYEIHAVAAYAVTARILGIRYYQFDRPSRISPVDFALGWKHMSQDDVLQDINISQSGRFYYWRTRNKTISERAIITSSANTHIIPADREIWRQLRRLKKNDTVTLRGYLVNVSGRYGFRWNTSLTRADQGDGACEILYVMEVIKH